MVPTPPVCGYAEVVLIGAGKAHKPCYTPTPTGVPIFYDTATPIHTRTTFPTSTPFIVRTSMPIIGKTPTPTQTPAAIFAPVATPTSTEVVVVVNPTLSPYLTKLMAEFTPIEPDIDIEDLEYRIYESLNNERVKDGLRPLDQVRGVSLIARSHSEDMVFRDFYAHESPDGFGPRDRSEQADYICPGRSSYGLGENIAQISLHAGYTDRNGVMDIQTWYTLEGLVLQFTYGWMNSRGHRANILESSYNSTGVGVVISEDYQVYATQNFC